MNTLLATTGTRNAIQPVREYLDQIRTDIEDLLQRRESLMLTTQAELTAVGIPAYVINSCAPEAEREVVGDIGFVTESYNGFSIDPSEARWSFHRNIRGIAREVGPYWYSTGLVIDRGDCEVILVDDDMMLVAQTTELGDTETPHRRAVSRLRTFARADGMRVSVRDREVSVINPMNKVVHVGDVITAFKWLTGILDTAAVN